MCTSTLTSTEADNKGTTTATSTATVAAADSEIVPAAAEEVAFMHLKTAEMEQQELCDLFGYRNLIMWDEYKGDQMDGLIKKLDLIICTEDPRELTTETDLPSTSPKDNTSTTATNSEKKQMASNLEKMKTMKKKLVETLWNQRKYRDDGSLRMSIISVACVSEPDKYNDNLSEAKSSHNYKMHPVFRVFRCSKNRGDSHSCCMIFVDEMARVYQNWHDFQLNNQYDKCVIVAPRMGIYNTDDEDKVLLDTFLASCLLLGNQVVKYADIGTTVTGLVATGVVTTAAVVALPAVAVAGAVGTGLGCAAYAIGRGIGKLMDRSSHEQSIALKEKESRGIWLGLAGGVVGVAAGAASKGVELAARNGQAINTFMRGGVNTLNISAIAVNGFGLADGCFNIFVAFKDGDSISALDLVQLGSSLFLFTHSATNFKTAEHIYTTTQQNTVFEFKQLLSKNQRKTFTKMFKETVRVSGPDAGTRDVIKSLRNIPNRNAFFRDLNKINKPLNENNIKISFDGSDKALLNHNVAVTPSELRSDLRLHSPEVVFADVPSRPQPNATRASTSSAAFGEPVYSSGLMNTLQVYPTLDSSFLNSLNLAGNAINLCRLAYDFFMDNRELIAEQCQIHFDNRFVDDIHRILRFLADRAGKDFADYLAWVTVDYLNSRIRSVFNNRYLQLAMRLIQGEIYVHYDHIVDGLRHIQSRIMDELGFRETILNLLENLTHVVVDKIVRIAKFSYSAMLDSNNGITEYQPFENYFDDVLQLLINMASQFDVDFSSYIILIERIDMEEIHLNISAFFRGLRSSNTSPAKKCEACGGSFTVSPLATN